MVLSIFSRKQYRFRFQFHCLVIGLALLLQGCQLFSFMGDDWLGSETGQFVTLESHEFALFGNQQMVGRLGRVNSRDEDTLPDLARHFGLGYNDIITANAQLDPWLLVDKQAVLLPLQFILPDAPRDGIVLNLANMRMFYYPKNQNRLLTYPIGIGRDGWHTPLGNTKIVAKRVKPAWTVPASILREHQLMGEPLPKVVPAGPNNPLGEYAMPLGFKGYLIHGTNKPYGIGMQVSHGCVQLYPEDVENLFQQVGVGTAVHIVHQPYMLAWDQNMLYLEAHQPLSKWSKQDKRLQREIRKKLQKTADEKGVIVDWQRVDAVLSRTTGVPTPVLLGSADLAALTDFALKVSHPDKLYGQPTVAELTDYDWSILIPGLDSAEEAEKLAAMLNHLGPQIPARKVEHGGSYKVAAGPFKSKKEAKIIAKRIKKDFDLDASLVPPKIY